MINVAKLFEDENVAIILNKMGYDKDSDAEEIDCSIREVCDYGMSSGVSGFIYYSENEEFYDAHKETISNYLSDVYSSFYEICPDNITTYDIISCSSAFKNYMVWAFVETVFRCIELDEEE